MAFDWYDDGDIEQVPGPRKRRPWLLGAPDEYDYDIWKDHPGGTDQRANGPAPAPIPTPPPFKQPTPPPDLPKPGWGVPVGADFGLKFRFDKDDADGDAALDYRPHLDAPEKNGPDRGPAGRDWDTNYSFDQKQKTARLYRDLSGEGPLPSLGAVNLRLDKIFPDHPTTAQLIKPVVAPLAPDWTDEIGHPALRQRALQALEGAVRHILADRRPYDYLKQAKAHIDANGDQPLDHPPYGPFAVRDDGKAVDAGSSIGDSIKQPDFGKNSAFGSPPVMNAVNPNINSDVGEAEPLDGEWRLMLSPKGRANFILVNPNDGKPVQDAKGRIAMADPVEMDELPPNLRRQAAELRKLWGIPDRLDKGGGRTALGLDYPLPHHDSPAVFGMLVELSMYPTMSTDKRLALQRRIKSLPEQLGAEWAPIANVLNARLKMVRDKSFDLPHMLSDEDLKNQATIARWVANIASLGPVALGGAKLALGRRFPPITWGRAALGLMAGGAAALIDNIYSERLRRLEEEIDKREFDRKHPK